MQISRTHDAGEAGVTVGNPPNQVTVRILEYVDDAALAAEDVSKDKDTMHQHQRF